MVPRRGTCNQVTASPVAAMAAVATVTRREEARVLCRHRDSDVFRPSRPAPLPFPALCSVHWFARDRKQRTQGVAVHVVVALLCKASCLG